MQRKKLLYYKKSKAAKGSELDYEYDLNSGGYEREIEGDYDRLSPQKIKQDYKRKHNFAYYEDRQQERRADRTNINHYIKSDNTFDVGEKEYYDYVMEDWNNRYSSDTDQLSEERNYKERKKLNNEGIAYDTKNTYKRNKNSRKSPNNYDEQRKIRDKTDFNVYISQNPLTYRYNGQDDTAAKYLEPKSHQKKKSKKRADSKILTPDLKPPEEYQIYMTDLNNTTGKIFRQPQIGDSIQTDNTVPHQSSPTNVKQLTQNISGNIAQSFLKLMYLPVYVISNQNVPQTTEGIQPSLFFNSLNKLSNRPDPGAKSQNLVSVYTAQNTDQNKDIKPPENQEKETLVSTQIPKENLSKVSKLDPITVQELKKKLCESSLGAAMTAEEYAALIASHPEQKHNTSTLTTIIKACKALKYKKSASSNNSSDQSDNKHEKQGKNYSKIKNATDTQQKSTIDAFAEVDYMPKEDNEQTSGGKSPKIENKFLPIKNEVLEENADDESIIINIREKPLRKAKKCVSNTKEKEIDQYKKVIGGSTLTSELNKMSEKNVPYSKSLIDREISIREYNFDLGQVKSNEVKNPSFISKNVSRISQGLTTTGNYKNVSNNQSVTKAYGLTDGNRTSVTSENNDVRKHLSQTQEDTKIYSFYTEGQSMINETHEKDSGKQKKIAFSEHSETFTKDELESLKKEKVISPKGILKKDNSTVPICGGKEKLDTIEHEPSQQKVNEENLIDNTEEGPPLEIILPPPGKSSWILSFNSIPLFQNEKRNNSINDYRSKLFKYTGTVFIVFFQTAQYILGVSCYDKLINVIEFFSHDY